MRQPWELQYSVSARIASCMVSTGPAYAMAPRRTYAAGTGGPTPTGCPAPGVQAVPGASGCARTRAGIQSGGGTIAGNQPGLAGGCRADHPQPLAGTGPDLAPVARPARIAPGGRGR